MTNPKGGAWERQIRDELRAMHWDVERLRLTGRNDEGDLRILHGMHVVIEAKNQKAMNLSAWLTEAEVEAVNYARSRLLLEPAHPVVFHKRRGRGSVLDGYATTSIREYLRLLPPF